MAALGGETGPVGCETKPAPHRNGSYISLWENLYQELEQRGYVLRLLHAGQTHQFHRQQRLRAKTDRLDAMTIARMLLRVLLQKI
ncbi:IS110 family transposase [Ktedonobacter robiniae]|uniref:IS110 family transposase n=1 Tax=Ktedonobacter robiniae TaxID=2778365 RepID=UPI001915B615